MYIRIGNDISFSISLSTIDTDSTENVKYAKGIFTALDQETIMPNPHCCPQFYDSEYTIHDCGMLSYNAMPVNACVEQQHSHNHGFCVYEDCSSPVRTNENKDSIILQFPGKHQKYCGRYKVELEVVLTDNESKVMRINFGEQFTLVGDGTGETGDICISLGDNVSSLDTYVMSTTPEYLQNLKGQFAIFMLNAKKFDYDTLPNKTINIDIDDNNDRLVIMSPFDNLQFAYNTFCFPVSRTKIGEYYLYVSCYAFNKQKIQLQISRIDGAAYPELDFSLDVDYAYVSSVYINSTDHSATTINKQNLTYIPVYAVINKSIVEGQPLTVPCIIQQSTNIQLSTINSTTSIDNTTILYNFEWPKTSGTYTVKYGNNNQNSFQFEVLPVTDHGIVTGVSVFTTGPEASDPDIDTGIRFGYISGDPIDIFATISSTTDLDLVDILASGPALTKNGWSYSIAPTSVVAYGSSLYKYSFKVDPNTQKQLVFEIGTYTVKYGDNNQNSFQFECVAEQQETQHNTLSNGILQTDGTIINNLFTVNGSISNNTLNL